MRRAPLLFVVCFWLAGCVQVPPLDASKSLPLNESIGRWRSKDLRATVVIQSKKQHSTTGTSYHVSAVADQNHRTYDGTLRFFAVGSRQWFQVSAEQSDLNRAQAKDLEVVLLGVATFNHNSMHIRVVDPFWLHSFVNEHPRLLKYDRMNNGNDLTIKVGPDEWYNFLNSEFINDSSFGPSFRLEKMK